MRSLRDIKPDEVCVIDKILTKDSMRRRFLDIGLIEGTRVKCVGQSPAGDPKAYLIRGAVIAIRASDCDDIIIKEE